MPQPGISADSLVLPAQPGWSMKRKLRCRRPLARHPPRRYAHAGAQLTSSRLAQRPGRYHRTAAMGANGTKALAPVLLAKSVADLRSPVLFLAQSAAG